MDTFIETINIPTKNDFASNANRNLIEDLNKINLINYFIKLNQKRK